MDDLSVRNKVFALFDENGFSLYRSWDSNAKKDCIYNAIDSDKEDPFYDRLKNYHGVREFIGYVNQKNLKYRRDGRVMAKIFYLFEAIKNVQNSDYKVFHYKNQRDLNSNYSQMRLTMVLNFDPPKRNLPRLLSYDTSAYCAYVPIPQQLSHLALLDAYEWRIWLALFFCILLMGFIWKLFKVKN